MVIKVYIAAGWFDSHQEDALNYLEQFLDDLEGFEVFSPRRETKIEGFEKPEVQQAVYDMNCKHILESDLVIASTVSKDMGTIYECGYAGRSKIPVIYTLFDHRLQNPIFNLMLAKSGIACFTDKDKFEKFVKTLTKENLKDSKIEYEGDFE